MKRINVEYFAMLQESAGKELETVEFEGNTYAELYEHLRARYSFPLPASMIQVASDDEFTLLEREVPDGAKVVFIPPVAGG